MLEWVMIGVVGLVPFESCTIIRTMVPLPGTELLVEAAGDSVRVFVPEAMRREVSFASDVEVPDSVWGQRFILRDALRADAEPGEPIVVVPWAYDSACRLKLWSESVVWVEPGRLAVFGPAFPWRPSEEGTAYHVRGWFQPYANGIPRMESEVEWLDTEDHFEFRRRFATEDPEWAEAAVRAWVRERPEVAEMNPVRWYLRERRR